jgi:tRNA-splicing ligase RtcB
MVQIFDGIPVWGQHDERTLAQIKRCADHESAVGAALMADGHLGYSQPIGGVVAYRDAISPSGVGYDVACGNKAVRTPLREADVRPDIKPLMDRIFREIPFGIGRAQAVKQDHALFDDPTWRDVPHLRPLEQLARQQLGTVGSGNHYVDLFVDEEGLVWVGVHFGSRGFGHRTASGFLNLAAGRAFGDKAPGESMDQPPTVLPLGSALGQEYLAAMQLAGRYAYAGRDAVVDQVLGILGTHAVEEVHNHHNYAWIENIGGEELVVVRKGATPNRPGQRSFIGGSMGDVSVIVEGVASDEGALSLDSTVHGAGRVMSRRRAAGKFNWKTRTHAGGEVSREMMLEWIGRMGVELRGAGTDESPHVYKRLPDVLATHANTVKVVHTLRPIGVAMAGEDVVDPYKD